MNEHELERWARELGRRAAEGLDVDGTARAVVKRLREQPTAHVGWSARERLRVAAAILLLLGAGMTLQRVAAPTAGARASYALDELHELTAIELEQVLATLDRTLSSGDTESGDVQLEELTPAQLESLLRALET